MDIPTCRVLSLCSGVGGLDLGLKLAMPTSRTVAYMEIEAYACEILVKRMQEKILDPAPLWSDIKSFDGKPWRGKVDIITGGYPCQPFSVAGKKLGEKDPRHLWPHVRRIVSEIEPMLCFFENVGGHLQLGFEQVHDDLQGLGYKVKAGLFTAEEVGAPHRRERLFILAYRNDGRCNSSGNDNTERQVCPNQERHSAPIHQERTQLQSGVSENSTPLADGFGIGSQRRLTQKVQTGYSRSRLKEEVLLWKQPKRWRTPNASDAEGGVMEIRPGTSARIKLRDHSVHVANCLCGHPDQMTLMTGEISQRTLNPRFIEWLMGWPTGWTELEPAATAWYLWWRRMRLQFLRLTLNLQQQVS